MCASLLPQILPNEDCGDSGEEMVLDYARWMGMDVERHRPLLWIAREALEAPLPPNWRACEDEAGGGVFRGCFLSVPA